jgi:hypothetical protein
MLRCRGGCGAPSVLFFTDRFLPMNAQVEFLLNCKLKFSNLIYATPARRPIFLEDQMTDRKPTPVKLDASKIESFKTACS